MPLPGATKVSGGVFCELLRPCGACATCPRGTGLAAHRLRRTTFSSGMMTGASRIPGQSSSTVTTEAVLATEVVLLRERGTAVTTEAVLATEVLLL